MGKKLDAQMKQQGRYLYKKMREPYKNPFECPRCLQPQRMLVRVIRKIKRDEQEYNVWLAACSSCGCKHTIELKPIYESIDAYSQICKEYRK